MPVVQGVEEDQADLPAAGAGQLQEGAGQADRRPAPTVPAGLLRQHQFHGRAGRPRAGRARAAWAGRQHDHRLHQRPRLPHGRARAVAEDEPVRGKRPRAADDRAHRACSATAARGRGPGRPDRPLSHARRTVRRRAAREPAGPEPRADAEGRRP